MRHAALKARHFNLLFLALGLLAAIAIVSAVSPFGSEAAPSDQKETADAVGGTWTATGPLTGARFGAPAVVLTSGKVLLTGGCTPLGLNTVQIYDPVTGVWSAGPAMSVARCAGTATLLANGKVLVAGGIDSAGTPLGSSQVYDPATNTWSNPATMTTPRYWHTANLLSNGKVLLSGGLTIGGNYIQSAELYDPATGTWAGTGVMANARYYHTATTLASGKVLVAGGTNGSGVIAASETYDPATGVWSAAGSMTAPRELYAATLLSNGKVLAAGGQDFNLAFVATSELYDPVANTWTATGSMSTVRGGFAPSTQALLLSNNKVLIAGGHVSSGVETASAELYNPTTGTWSLTGSMNTARGAYSSVLLQNGNVLVAGGNTGGGTNTATAELYTVGSALNDITTYDAAIAGECVIGAVCDFNDHLTSNQKAAADVSANCTISSLDIASITRYVTNLSGSNTTGTVITPPGPCANYPLTMNVLKGDISGSGPFPAGTPPNGMATPNASATPAVSLPAGLGVAPFSVVVVPISVSNLTGSGIYSYDLQVTFDPNVITPASPSFDQTGTLSSTGNVLANTGNPGHLIISLFQFGSQGEPTLTGSGTLLNLRFNASGLQGSSTALTFENYTDSSGSGSHVHQGFVFNEGAPGATITNGSIGIIDPTPSNSPTFTPTPTRTNTPAGTVTSTATNTPTSTITSTATNTATPTGTATRTNTPTATPTPCAQGALDLSFGGTGKVTTSLNSNGDGARSVAVQADGKIVAAGYVVPGSGANRDLAIVRYNTDGTLDTSFSGDGIATGAFGDGDDEAFSVAIQSDGKIVAAGYTLDLLSGNIYFAVARFNSNGTLDTTFSGDGMATIQVSGGSDFGQAVLIQPDGKILVAGYYTNLVNTWVVFRLNSNGTLDTTFDGDGIVTTAFAGDTAEARSIAIQPDGKLIVAGSARLTTFREFAVARYNTNGSPDTSFDTDGTTTTPIGEGEAFGQSVALQSDGRIVVAGTASFAATGSDFAVVRYNSNGSLDTSFDGDGKVTTTFAGTSADNAYSTAIQADGRIVVAGSSVAGSQTGFAIARYDPVGNLDASFHGDGKVVTLFTGNSEALGLAIQGDGKLVAAGYNDPAGTDRDFALARYVGSCASPSISGVITYGNAVGNPPPPRLVRNVTLQSTSGSPAVGPVITGTPGTYALTGFGSGSYTIKPTKPGGANTAITSADAARVAQGVAGSVPFVSQNQRFAGDTSGNGGPNPVTSNDAALIARFAAGLTGFGRTGTWFFFVTGAPSPMPTAPATYNDSRTYASVTTNLTGEDYVAILVGEVTGNYNPANNARSGAGPEKTISVELPQITDIERGKEVVVPIRIEGAVDKNISSYQFDLRYDPSVIEPLADPVDVTKTSSRGLSFAVNPYEPGLLRVVMYGAFPIDDDGVLLNLRCTAVGGAGTASPLTFERIMFNEGDPAVTATGGQVVLN